jgi:SnoaL-like domain
MDAFETLLAVEEIKKLKSKYFRSMDLKDEALYRTLLTEDFTFEAPNIITDPVTGYSPYPDPMSGPVVGREACASGVFAAVAHPDHCSVHIGHMPDIDILDPDHATGIWTMTDVVNFPGPDGTVTLIGYGHYHDTFRREAGVWKMASVTLKRIRIDYPFEMPWLEKTRQGKANDVRFEIAGLRSEVSPGPAYRSSEPGASH